MSGKERGKIDLSKFEKIFGGFLIFAIIVCSVILAYGIYDENRPPNITEGKIVELNHKKQYSELVMEHSNSLVGKVMVTRWQPTYNYYPEAFEVVIKDGEKKENFYVKMSSFKKLTIGDRFNFNDKKMKNKRPMKSRDATPEEEKKMDK